MGQSMSALSSPGRLTVRAMSRLCVLVLRCPRRTSGIGFRKFPESLPEPNRRPKAFHRRSKRSKLKLQIRVSSALRTRSLSLDAFCSERTSLKNFKSKLDHIVNCYDSLLDFGVLTWNFLTFKPKRLRFGGSCSPFKSFRTLDASASTLAVLLSVFGSLWFWNSVWRFNYEPSFESCCRW